jgi:hypothetical protein
MAKMLRRPRIIEMSYQEMAEEMLLLSKERFPPDDREVCRQVLQDLRENTIPDLAALRKVSDIYKNQTDTSPCKHLMDSRSAENPDPLCALRVDGTIHDKRTQCSHFQEQRDCPDFEKEE